MSKSPEEYFQTHEFETQAQEQQISEGERAFLEKYVGVEEGDVLEKLGLEAPVDARQVVLDEAVDAATGEQVAVEEVTVAAPQTEIDLDVTKEFEDFLRTQPELQLVSFFMGHQEYTVPIQAVQEVIRFVEPTSLPESPPYLAGMVNLRGKITACVTLATLMGIETPAEDGEEGEGMEPVEMADAAQSKFIIVCQRQGVQVGLIVEQVATMYRVPQDQIEWNIEQRMGGMVEIITALMRRGDELLGIISVDRIVEKVLKQ